MNSNIKNSAEHCNSNFDENKNKNKHKYCKMHIRYTIPNWNKKQLEATCYQFEK